MPFILGELKRQWWQIVSIAVAVFLAIVFFVLPDVEWNAARYILLALASILAAALPPLGHSLAKRVKTRTRPESGATRVQPGPIHEQAHWALAVLNRKWPWSVFVALVLFLSGAFILPALTGERWKAEGYIFLALGVCLGAVLAPLAEEFARRRKERRRQAP